MDEGSNDKRFESIYSTRVRAGKRRTYFFDVRQTKGEDYYLTLTESTKRFNGEGYERHKIFLYKEDFNRFVSNLEDVINHIKTELMPDYDYEEYDRRNAEYEAQRAAELAEGGGEAKVESSTSETTSTTESTTTSETTESTSTETSENTEIESEDDMSW